MIRGAIELATSDVVQGWLHCAFRPLKGETVLAFVGPRCVGAGKISVLREDLRAVGLGDGFAGFSFKVTLPPAATAQAIVIKLEGSDLSLMQQDAVVGAGIKLALAR